ncbi:RNA polymerase sigma-70 factor, sigma-E family [Frankineae bacterium MT45]|nr:RNA polymerase sigma-70 factor, sigma-E family [Frankineae bacterium MT45]
MINAHPVDFHDYVVCNQRALLRFATVLSGQTWLADDLVADVLGRAFERWDRIGAVADPHAYVRRMIVNDYLSWRRRLVRTTPRGEIESSESAPDLADEYAERNVMITRLSALPRKQRAAVVLRFYVGMSDADIADVLDCREITVRSQISRALATLRLALASPPPALAQEF